MIEVPLHRLSRLPLKQLIRELEEFRSALKAKKAHGHPNWRISQCICSMERIIELDEARGLEEKERVREDFMRDIEEICFGYQEGTIMHGVYRNFPIETLLPLREMFVSGSLPTTSDDGDGNSGPSDDLFEKYAEVMLKKAGCNILGWRVAGRTMEIDFHGRFGRKQFAVECKRVKSRERIEEHVSKARKQLTDFREKHNRCRPIIVLDWSLPICRIIKEVSSKPGPFLEYTAEQIWGPLSDMYEKEVCGDERNWRFNFVGIGLIPFFESLDQPTIYFGLLTSEKQSMFRQLTDTIIETGGRYDE